MIIITAKSRHDSELIEIVRSKYFIEITHSSKLWCGYDVYLVDEVVSIKGIWKNDFVMNEEQIEGRFNRVNQKVVSIEGK